MIIDQDAVTLDVSETVRLSAITYPIPVENDKMVWSSSNESVATVDANGQITAVAPGNATITVTYGEISADCAVTVEGKQDGINAIPVDKSDTIIVYNLQGIRIKVSSPDEVKNLPSGVYIINGEKVLIK